MLTKTIPSPQQAAAKINVVMAIVIGGVMTIGSPEKQ